MFLLMVFIGGGFVGGNDALLLDDSDGDGVWSVVQARA